MLNKKFSKEISPNRHSNTQKLYFVCCVTLFLKYSFEDNELYFLSFVVLAKPGRAKDLTEADDMGRKAVAEFIDSLLA